MSTTQTYIATEWTWYFLDSTLHVSCPCCDVPAWTQSGLEISDDGTTQPLYCDECKSMVRLKLTRWRSQPNRNRVFCGIGVVGYSKRPKRNYRRRSFAAD